jgi:translation initiation factor 1
MAAQRQKNDRSDRMAYREFGSSSNDAALERAVPNLPPEQQNLRVEASRKGRGGKTVTTIGGFQLDPQVLAGLLKQLKTQCGTGGTMKDNTLEIQGDVRQKVAELLGKLGYKVKLSGGK